MEQKRIKVRLTENSPYSEYGYYEKGDIGYIDGYVNGCAVIILENGKFAKAELRWIEVVNEEDKNTNTEFKESEDERIRKSIIELLNEVHFTFKYYNINKMLAWLEKQGEQKPAWSEEDEEMFKTIANSLDRGLVERVWHTTIKEVIAWLKSLKDRVQPQIKQEWREEDELQFSAAIEICHKSGHKMTANWLKSLRHQKQWKPSDEQMEALHYVTNFDYGGHKATLVSLYEQLKAL